MREPLLTEIETFLAKSSVKETSFGKQILNDANFVKDLRRGRRVLSSTADKVRQYIAEHSQSGEA